MEKLQQNVHLPGLTQSDWAGVSWRPQTQSTKLNQHRFIIYNLNNLHTVSAWSQFFKLLGDADAVWQSSPEAETAQRYFMSGFVGSFFHARVFTSYIKLPEQKEKDAFRSLVLIFTSQNIKVTMKEDVRFLMRTSTWNTLIQLESTTRQLVQQLHPQIHRNKWV